MFDLEEASCRLCGCTDNAACPGGCSWVEDPEFLGDLCSQCLPKAQVAAAAPYLLEALRTLSLPSVDGLPCWDWRTPGGTKDAFHSFRCEKARVAFVRALPHAAATAKIGKDWSDELVLLVRQVKKTASPKPKPRKRAKAKKKGGARG